MAIDLRSDTVTKPTPAMLEAIAAAEVGDDVYGEDPTVNRLQEQAASLLGKDAAIFVPSGTMANQCSIHAQTRPGDIVLAGRSAHILRYESGAASALSGVQIKEIGSDGLFTAEDIAASIPSRDPHLAPVTLVAFENTHNAAGGRVWPIEQFESASARARQHGVRVHLDGARLFNAVTASEVPPQRWATACDTVSFCFSKGLGAPVGSIVCGDAEVIERIHRLRKMFGGGMRQAGILAAAASHALNHHIDRLRDDHTNATRLAQGLMDIGLTVTPQPVTNIVLFHCTNDRALLHHLRKRGVLVSLMSPGTFRAVTHLGVNCVDIDRALQLIDEAHSIANAE